MTAPRPDLDALLAHADWLHRLGLQLARDHHAAADAAQEALLAATRTPPGHERNLRGYLARALRNLLMLQQRRQQRRRAREQEVAARRANSASSAAELVERAELHQFLGQCVLELPEPQRTLVLQHYFEGTAIASLATTTHLSSDAIRAHLRRARDTLRLRLERVEKTGAARAFTGLLTTTAAAPMSTLLVMTTTSKLLGSAMVAAILLSTWAMWARSDDAPVPASHELASRRAQSETSSRSATAPTPGERVPALDLVAAPTTGSLDLRVLWADGSVGHDLRVRLWPEIADFDADRMLVTDRDGRIVVHGLPATTGQLVVENRRGSQFAIQAGQTTTHAVQLPAGVTVRGIVVDERSVPVPTARLWLSMQGRGDEGLELGPVAADGTFMLRDLPLTESYIAAIAPGKRVSPLVAVIGQEHAAQDVRIELREPGVTLHGRVHRADGSPAAGARVLVGDRASKPYWRESVWRSSRPPADLRCDEHGHFHADGLAPGQRVRVWLRADDTAPANYEVLLPSSGDCAQEFALTPGATVRGRATASDGAPAADATIVAWPTARQQEVESNRYDQAPAFATITARTDAQGRYVLRHAPPGVVSLVAKRHQPVESAEERRTLRDGDDIIWHPQLTQGTTLRGAVVDDAGNPLVGWRIQAVGEAPGQNRNATTDAEGQFTLPDCGQQHWQLTATAPNGFAKFPNGQARAILAGTEGLRIVVPRSLLPTATIHGRIARTDGQPATKARLWLWSETSHTVEVIPDTFDGEFHFGLLSPGVWRACAEHDGRRSPWTERFVLREGIQDLGLLRISGSGAADITVEDAVGHSLDGVECHVLGAIEDQDLVVAAGVVKQGRLRCEGLPEGPHRVRVVDRKLPRCEVAFSVAADETVPIRVVVPTSVRCTLVTQPVLRGGLQRFSWRWVRDGEAPIVDTEWNDTRSERRLLRHLVPGNYALTITASDGAQLEQCFTIAASDPPDRELPVRLP